MWKDVPNVEVFTKAATTDGLGTGKLPVGMTRVNVTSANVNNIITLPNPTPGVEIILKNGATGYEIRTSNPATIALQGATGAAFESAVPANATVHLYCASTTSWTAYYHTFAAATFLEVAAA